MATIIRSMNNKHLLIVAAVAVMLIGATALSISDSAFAGKKSQAASQANACGNGKLPENIFCQNLFSQIQGDGNAVNIIGVQ